MPRAKKENGKRFIVSISVPKTTGWYTTRFGIFDSIKNANTWLRALGFTFKITWFHRESGFTANIDFYDSPCDFLKPEQGIAFIDKNLKHKVQ
jgi:hypothetical protein